MNKFQHLIKTIFISGFAVLINFGITFFLTPYITTRVGTDAYGYVSLSKTFMGYFELFTIAINSYAARYIAIEYHKGDYKKSNIYYSTVFFSNLLIGILFFVAGIFVSWNVDKFFDIRAELLYDVRILFFLTFTNWFINLVGSSFSTAAYVKNRLDMTGVLKCTAYFCQILTLFVLFSAFTPHVSYMGVGFFVTSFVIICGNLYITRHYASDMSINRRLFDFKAVKDLVISGVWNSLNSLGNMLNSGLDLMVCNLMISSVAMGELAIAKTFSSFFSMVFQVITQPFQPLLLKAYAKNDMTELLFDFKLAMKLCGMFSVVIVSGFIALGKQFYQIWMPDQNNRLLYNLTILCIGTAVAEGIIFPLYYIYTLTVKNRIPCVVTICGGLLNVLLMYMLCNTNLGVYAVALTTIVIMGVINLIFNPIYMARCLKIAAWSFYEVIVKHLAAFILITAVFYSLTQCVHVGNWLTMIVLAVFMCCIGIIIYALIQFRIADFKRCFRKCRINQR